MFLLHWPLRMAAGNCSSVLMWKTEATAKHNFASTLPANIKKHSKPVARLCPCHIDSRSRPCRHRCAGSRLPQLAPETRGGSKAAGPWSHLSPSFPVSPRSVFCAAALPPSVQIFLKPPKQTSVRTCAPQHTCTEVSQV